MNLQSCFNLVADAVKRGAAAAGLFPQIFRGGSSLARPATCPPVRARRIAVAFTGMLGFAAASTVSAQTNYYSGNGSEYAIVGSLPGDQVFPDVAISPTGGFLVWQDNATDGDGWGISARRLDSTLSGTLGTFRVNVQGTNDQERARVALLKNGGAVFTWQGGMEGYQHIFARFLTPTNTFLTTTDVLVSTFGSTGSFQVNPAVAVLSNSNVVFVWSSFNQAGPNSLLDVYAKILSPTGGTVSGEFLVNQFTNYNQRTPAVAALAGGGFVVTWVSEQQRLVAPVLGSNTTYTAASAITTPSVDIYARLYQNNGTAVNDEFPVNSGSNPSAIPYVAAPSPGIVRGAWSDPDTVIITNGGDVYARPFSSAGNGGTTVRLNTFVQGSQYAPHLSAVGLDYLAGWTSLGQDGSREGVYGQCVHNDGSLVGHEFRVNTTTVSQQMQPVVASDGGNQFLVVWTSYTGGANSFDLFAQRYLNASAMLTAMPAPFVYAPFTMSNGVYQPQLQVSWAPLLGIAVSNYEVYVNGSATPMGVVTSNQWVMTAANGLTASSTNTFQVDYVRMDGQRPPLSPATVGSTWSGLNWGGIPFEWMTAYYGSDISQWPSAGARLAPNLTLHQVLLSGGNPMDSATWLQETLQQTAQGMFLEWNTQPGATYQVQQKTDLTAPWSNLGSPRFAAGTTDSIYVGGSPAGYYRVTLLRQ